MATAKQTQVEVQTVTLEDRVVLELTKREATVLRLILDRIGGNPKTTDRGAADAMAKALGNVGIPYVGGDSIIDRRRDVIFFTGKIEE